MDNRNQNTQNSPFAPLPGNEEAAFSHGISEKGSPGETTPVPSNGAGRPHAAPSAGLSPGEVAEATPHVYRRQTADPAQTGQGKRHAILALVCGAISILTVMVHFFLSPLNRYLTVYNGKFFSLVPILFAVGGIIFSVLSRKQLPKEENSLATMGLISSIIGLTFGLVQFATCTLCVHFNFLGL